jgi:hypothetical protein
MDRRIEVRGLSILSTYSSHKSIILFSSFLILLRNITLTNKHNYFQSLSHDDLRLVKLKMKQLCLPPYPKIALPWVVKLHLRGTIK